jgi:hypothetical protein
MISSCSLGLSGFLLLQVNLSPTFKHKTGSAISYLLAAILGENARKKAVTEEWLIL